MHRRLRFQPISHDGDQHVGAAGDPDLRLHGILGGAEGDAAGFSKSVVEGVMEEAVAARVRILATGA